MSAHRNGPHRSHRAPTHRLYATALTLWASVGTWAIVVVGR